MNTALYRHYGEGGELLYVGISLNAVNRLSQHKQTSAWFEDIVRVEVEWHPSREVAIEKEREAVREESPKYNIRLQSKKEETKRSETLGASQEMMLREIVNYRPLYSLAEASTLTGLSQRALRAAVSSGDLVAFEEPPDWFTHVQVHPKTYVTGWALIDFLENAESLYRRLNV